MNNDKLVIKWNRKEEDMIVTSPAEDHMLSKRLLVGIEKMVSVFSKNHIQKNLRQQYFDFLCELEKAGYDPCSFKLSIKKKKDQQIKELT